MLSFFAQLLQNHKVSFVPGWDCHGLPIELKGEFIYREVYGNTQVSIIPSSYDHILGLVELLLQICMHT